MPDIHSQLLVQTFPSALLRSGDLLTHHRENRLSTPAVACYHAFELRAPVRRHAEAADDDVADLVDAVAHREAPINSDRLNCWAEGFGIAEDFAHDDHPIRCEPAAGGSGPIAIADILEQSIEIGEQFAKSAESLLRGGICVDGLELVAEVVDKAAGSMLAFVEFASTATPAMRPIAAAKTVRRNIVAP
jgi:hypothetical protein